MEFRKTDRFDYIYQDMRSQFPPEELKPYEHLKNLVGNRYKILEVIESEPVGYIILFETEKFIFIDYVAIYKKFHSQGFGGKILERLKETYNKNGCFLEVEKPNPQNTNTIRRIKFYERHGAKKLDFNYIYPASGLPMDLYYIPYTEESPSKEEIREFIGSLFEHVHYDIKDNKIILEKIFG